MPLALTMAAGEDFYVGDDRFEVEEVFLTEGFTLRGPDGVLHSVDAKKSVDIAPEVRVSDGHRVLVGKARIVFNAPRSVPILRGQLYREQRPDAAE
jgi:hypothetical protein